MGQTKYCDKIFYFEQACTECVVDMLKFLVEDKTKLVSLPFPLIQCLRQTARLDQTVTIDLGLLVPKSKILTTVSHCSSFNQCFLTTITFFTLVTYLDGMFQFPDLTDAFFVLPTLLLQFSFDILCFHSLLTKMTLCLCNNKS